MSEYSGLRVQPVTAGMAQLIEAKLLGVGYTKTVRRVANVDVTVLESGGGDVVTTAVKGTDGSVCAETSSPVWVVVAYGPE